MQSLVGGAVLPKEIAGPTSCAKTREFQCRAQLLRQPHVSFFRDSDRVKAARPN